MRLGTWTGEVPFSTGKNNSQVKTFLSWTFSMSHHWHLLILPVEVLCIYLLADFSVKPRLLQGRCKGILNVKILALTWLLSYPIYLQLRMMPTVSSLPFLLLERCMGDHWRAARNRGLWRKGWKIENFMISQLVLPSWRKKCSYWYLCLYLYLPHGF